MVGVPRAGVLLLAAAAGPAPNAAGLQSPVEATPLGLDIYFAVPEDNRLTPAKVAIGRRLFFDPVLSADSTIACASCHRPQWAFSDTIALSRGIRGQLTGRNAPSILNRAYGALFFWDGRSGTLEETVLQPIQNPTEMGLDLGHLTRRLRTDPDYTSEFDRAFGDGVTERNVGRALASYVRTLRSGGAPVDRFQDGDRSALGSDELAGMKLFVGRAKCAACHAGPTFSDEQVHNTGVSLGSGDRGRFGVTGRSEELGAFKTPSLRNVALTAPYMHDGSVATLEDVVDFYDRGGGANPNLDPELRPLGLSPVEKRQLVAFLRALTGNSLALQDIPAVSAGNPPEVMIAGPTVVVQPRR